jgi:hypothetical protein
VSDLDGILVVRDREREAQLLERCLLLEQSLGELRTDYQRICRAGDWLTAAATHAEIAQMRDIERLGWKAIANRLGLPESTAMYRYKRAKRADGPR